VLVEQALYTSARTRSREGYQLISTSPGIDGGDRRALSMRCPSHGALLEESETARSVNFFRLPSGMYCVSRTVTAGQEYSDRDGPRLLTHCLLVPPEVLERFANNAFAVLEAALASGVMDEVDERASRLPPVEMVGRASAVDAELLDAFATELGCERLAALINAALDNRTLGICGRKPAEAAIAALVQCFPPELRVEFPFSTGLKYSARRPCRVISVNDDPQEHRRLARQYKVVCFNVDSSDIADAQEAGWGHFVAQTVLERGADTLHAQFLMPRPGITLEQLPELAEQLAVEAVPAEAVRRSTLSRVHAPHRGERKSSPAPLPEVPEGPGSSLSFSTDVDPELLEQLDDAVYEAMAGKEQAARELERLWPQLLAQLDRDNADQSRERYLEFALAVWESFLSDSADPKKALAVLDVIDVLFRND